MNYNKGVWHLKSPKWLHALLWEYCVLTVWAACVCAERMRSWRSSWRSMWGRYRCWRERGAREMTVNNSHTHTHTRTRHQYDLKLDFISASQRSEKHTQEKRSSLSFPDGFVRWQMSLLTVWILVKKEVNLSLLCLSDLSLSYLCLCWWGKEVTRWLRTNVMLEANTISMVDHGGSYNG